MKIYLKKVISFLTIFMFLVTLLPLGSMQAFAKSTDKESQSEIHELSAEENVTAYKNWFMNFSEEVNLENLSSEDILVTDAKGNPVAVKLTQGETKKILVVNYPEEGYKPGETYYLNVSKSMVSKTSSTIGKATRKKFIISTDESVNVKPAKFAANVKFFDATQSKVAVSNIQDILETSDGTEQIILKPDIFEIINPKDINKKASLYNIKSGEIFIFESNKDNPNGFSGKVISITKNSHGNKVITFVQPEIEELFSQLEFKTKKELKAEDLISKNLPEGATLSFNNEAIGGREVTSGTTKFSEMSLNIPRFVMTDKDKDRTTTEDQIALSGKFDITNAILTTDINIKKYSWKPLGITVVRDLPIGISNASIQLTADSHQEAKLDLYYEKTFSLKSILEQENGYDLINTYKKDSKGKDDTDKTGFKAGIAGSDLGDRYVIGSATFGLGAVQTGFAEVVQGMPSKSVVIGATLFFTTTIAGEIKVSASFNFTNDTHIDSGMRYDGGKVTSIGNGATNKPSYQFILNGEVKFTVGLGVGAGLVVFGIIVASVTVDVLEELQLNGYVYYQKKYAQEGIFAGKLNGSIIYRVKGDAQWGIYLEIAGTLKMWIFPKIELKTKLGIKPESAELFNVKLFEFPFTLLSKGTPKDVFAADYFNNVNLSGAPILSRIEGEINHLWTDKSPGTNVDKKNFSVRWVGDFDFEATKYNFLVSADDGVRVYIDDKLVIDKWFPQAETCYEVALDMTSGKHNVKVEYFQALESAVIRCNWARADASFKASYFNSKALAIKPIDPGDFTGSLKPVVPADLTVPVVVRMENNIYYDWNGAPPVNGLTGTNYTVNWEGNFNFEGKNYTFNVLPTDGAKVYVDGVMIIDAWENKAGVLSSVTMPLSNGKHDVKVEYRKGNWSLAGSSIRFDWGIVPENKFMSYYYNNETLSGAPVYMELENDINHSWGSGKPAPNVSKDNFSTVWQGNFDFDGGDYYFYGNADDGFKAYIDGNLVIDQWNGSQEAFKSISKNMAKGKHLIKFESREGTGDASAKFKWEKADNNFIVSYFNNKGLSGDAAYIDTESSINHPWNGGSPVNGYVNPTNFSARWDGTFDFEGGNYTFMGGCEDGIKVYIDGNPIIDYWTGCNFYFTKVINIAPGKHKVKVEFYQGTGSSNIQLDWAITPKDTFIAKYYNNDTMTGNPAYIGTEDSIDYEWGTDSPIKGVNKDHFSVKWEGDFTFDEAGKYTFVAGADDGIRVYIDGNAVIEEWKVQSSAYYTADVNLTKGDHKIKVEYYDNEKSANAKVFWSKAPIEDYFIGFYYNNKDLSGTPAYVSINDKIDFDWGKESPVPNVDSDTFSARWEGSFNFEAGDYKFKTTSDDGIRVYVDGDLLIQDWTIHGAKVETKVKKLSAGRHTIKVEYFENKSTSVAKLSWSK
jgi:hypothetical protein